jgi:hypothetical protein
MVSKCMQHRCEFMVARKKNRPTQEPGTYRGVGGGAGGGRGGPGAARGGAVWQQRPGTTRPQRPNAACQVAEGIVSTVN